MIVKLQRDSSEFLTEISIEQKGYPCQPLSLSVRTLQKWVDFV